MAVQERQKEYHIDTRPIARPAIPEIFMLKYDELGRDAVALMNERFEGIPSVELSTSNLQKGKPIGYSNLFRRYALGDIVREITGCNIRPITPAESEIALDTYLSSNGIYGFEEDPRTFYEDLGIVLYTKPSSNEQLRQHILKQAEERGLEVRLPALATSLSTVKDSKFEYGVRLDIRAGEIYHAYHDPILSEAPNTFNTDDPELVKTGLPSKLGSGTRTLYTSNSGLGRFGRDRNLVLDADVSFILPDSIVASRVNFVKFAEGERGNFEGRLVWLRHVG